MKQGSTPTGMRGSDGTTTILGPGMLETTQRVQHVFMSYTGRTIRDAEAAKPLKAMAKAWRGRR